MTHRNLRDFITALESLGDLKRVAPAVDPHLEITEICSRTLRARGPALLFEHPKDSNIPLLGNLFGTGRRVAMAIGRESVSELREVGHMLAFLREPQLPKGIGEALEKLPAVRQLLSVPPRAVNNAPCQEHTLLGTDVDLSMLPIQTCWPEDAGPLITFGLVITRGPYKERQNIGIYRQQVIAPNKVIMRWLPHRGGAINYREWREAHPRKRFPVAVAIGADPATLVSAVTPM
ncbi:MAG: UbiD family decarboxylase domain-containing protein, partial [Acidiferrobacterales bacterium]